MGGKTVAIFALISAYQLAYPESAKKFIFCTRTYQEMNIAIKELRSIMDYRKEVLIERGIEDPAPLFALGHSARKNMCIHDRVKRELDKEKSDAMCSKLTSSW